MDTHFGLTATEYKLFRRLNTPEKIQDFLDTLPANFEVKGETHRSPRAAIKANTAHCIEGALIAAAALWVNGQKPLIMDLHSAPGDDDHVIALYTKNGYWGALSKSNHATIRFRDAVYKTPRELVMSYFHEWFPERTGQRTLRSYSAPINLKKLGTGWITADKDLWYIDKVLNTAPHYPIAPKANLKNLRKADKMETQAGSITEWLPNKRRRAGVLKKASPQKRRR